MGSRQGNSRGGGPLGLLSKGISGAIGLGYELHAHNKQKKAAQQQTGQSNNDPSTNENQYERSEPDLPSYNEVVYDENSFSAASIERPITIEPLPYPVILPQRRPNDKSRGFVRAYPPDLMRYKGIDQDTFLNFLKDFHKNSQASPVFGVINVAAMAAGFAPGWIAMVVSTAVLMASQAGEEAHSRYRTNTYLDKINQDMFHPANLHCMIMTWKPDAAENVFLQTDVNSGSTFGVASPFNMLKNAVSNRSDVSGSSGTSTSKFRRSDGVTKGEMDLPQAAPLIFPTVSHDTAESDDNVEDSEGRPPAKKESSFKETRKFVSDYKDRRAQASFAGKHGVDSKLAVPGATDSGKFASRFSDPNHPVNSGNPLALLSGGKLGGNQNGGGGLLGMAGGLGRGRGRPGDDPNQQYQQQNYRQQNQSRGGLLGGAKNFMKQDVLYLLIAEMPSREEMEQIVGEL